jgi:pimeloyl-ACP methyl ester carboxylesterase
MSIARRPVLKGGAALAGLALLTPTCANAAAAAENPMTPVPIPAQVSAKAEIATLPQTKLWYWDTGGNGTPVVLLHPATGSSEIWGYQQPVLARAGHRVIAYSRRGYFKSDPVPKENPGTASGDLADLLDHLSVRKCHLVGSAAGCAIGLDFALSNPARLYSLTLACGVGGILDEEYAKMAADIRLPGFDALPAEFRELSPSYRASNPQGTAQWAALEHAAITGNRVGQIPANRITFAALEKMTVPTLLIGGDADLAVAPPMLRAIQSHLPDAELMFVPEAGHSVYWEQPEAFNRALLAFFARHAA